MNLHLATVAQLIEWQAAIVDELARRAQPPAPPPPVAVPPWEMAAPAPSPLDGCPICGRTYCDHTPAARAAVALAIEKANANARVNALPAPPPQPPAMLAGQRGAMHATHKTDPALLARMQQMPPRPEGSPPVQGNGKGEGQIAMEPR